MLPNRNLSYLDNIPKDSCNDCQNLVFSLAQAIRSFFANSGYNVPDFEAYTCIKHGDPNNNFNLSSARPFS